MREILKVADALDSIREINALDEIGHIDIYPSINRVCLGVSSAKQITDWHRELSELIGWTELRYDFYEYKGTMHHTLTGKCGDISFDITHIAPIPDCDICQTTAGCNCDKM